MSDTTAILAIDQGTTSSRTIAFSKDGQILAQAQQEFPQIYPKDGWVEHDPEAIWQTVLSTLTSVWAELVGRNITVIGIGITNQRETTLVWDRASGKPVYNAIVWQDRRTAETCRTLKQAYGEAALNAKTGLLFDPYFSASKIGWILDHVDGARDKAAKGELAFGTVDSFLIYRLTGGASHVTDATNASRTSLFNIHTQSWDKDLLELFHIPHALLPEVKDCADMFGHIDPSLLGWTVPILGVAGDQQAAAIGQACFQPGHAKSTYGTGCFIILNTGQTCIRSDNRLLSTVGYRFNGEVSYALEGSIFIAGAAVQWLRDEVELIQSASETESLARSAQDRAPIFFVPAFTGLGAPHWDPDARGAMFGLTRDTNKADIVRATLESVCWQTHDLLHAMREDGAEPSILRVDGGMVENSWMCQRLSDFTQRRIDRPVIMETTALGAAYLAGLQAGLYNSLDDIASNWQLDQDFQPVMTAADHANLNAGWQTALSRTLSASHIQPNSDKRI